MDYEKALEKARAAYGTGVYDDATLEFIFPQLQGTRPAKNPATNVTRAAIDSLRELGYKPRWNPAQKAITFYYFGNKVTFFPKKGYFNGKGLTPGYGLEDLLNQLKEKPIPKIQ